MVPLEGKRYQGVVFIAAWRDLSRGRAAEDDGIRKSSRQRVGEAFGGKPVRHEEQNEARAGILELAPDVGKRHGRILRVGNGDPHRLRRAVVQVFQGRRRAAARMGKTRQHLGLHHCRLWRMETSRTSIAACVRLCTPSRRSNAVMCALTVASASCIS